MTYKEKIVKISKHLSYVLRHNPESIGITLDKNGWADVELLIKKSQEKIEFTIDELKEVVKTSDKQRFKFNEDGSKIMANQGHSIQVDLQLQQITPPFKLYHGTAQRFLPFIMKEGLKKMNRHHVHMYSEENLGKAKDTGARHQKDAGAVILVIEAKQMHNEGYKFYKTDNDVYLTDTVPSKYIKIYENEKRKN
jgi:putative RNA 2'-phosphotransferase